MVTGVVGMVTGVVGAVTGRKAYQRSNQIKALDLRIEAEKARVNLQVAIGTLRDLIPAATTSRMAVLAMSAAANSSMAAQWDARAAADTAALNEIASKAPAETVEYEGWSAESLAQELVRVHGLNLSVSDTTAKYRAELTADDEARRARAHQVNAQNGALLSRR